MTFCRKGYIISLNHDKYFFFVSLINIKIPNYYVRVVLQSLYTLIFPPYSRVTLSDFTQSEY